MTSPADLLDWYQDALERSYLLVLDLSEAQDRPPYQPMVTPFLWELGHTAWFHESFVLRRQLGREELLQGSEGLFNSMEVPHERRWHLALPSREEIVAYCEAVKEAVASALEEEPEDGALREVVQLAIHHQDMHNEAFTQARQTLGYAPPAFAFEEEPREEEEAPEGDASFPAGTFRLGAPRDRPFTFDHERWEHPVEHGAFALARRCVSEGDFLAFVEEGGYERRELWSPGGWRWREEAGARLPVYWRRRGKGFEKRFFDRSLPLEPGKPMVHVNWHEARAWCHWAERRLPSEVEWEVAASENPGGGAKRPHPWGEEEAAPARANLDWRNLGCVETSADPAGETASGCRQMLGNVWEWTEDRFLPYPGFVPGTYPALSRPWFGSRKVLRGGSWATASRLARNTYRNYFEPHRQDLCAGFRTCPLRT